MSDLLSTYYNERYTDNKPHCPVISQQTNSQSENLLSTKGRFSFLSTSNKFLPLSTNFIQKNRNVNDINNVFPHKHPSITSLTKRPAFNSTDNIFANSRNKYNRNQRKRDSLTSIVNQKTVELLQSTASVDSTDLQTKRHQKPTKTLSEYHDKVISPMVKIKQNFNQNPEDLRLFKSNSALANCFGTEEARNQLIRGVNSYKDKYEKYHRLQLSKMNPSNLYTKDKYLNSKLNFQHSHQNELVFKDMSSSRNFRSKLSKYPIEIQMLTNVNHLTFNERLKRAQASAEKTMNIVINQRKFIAKKIKNLNDIIL